MFEKFLTKNAGDFRQRYKGTFGFYHRDNTKTLVRLDSIDLERKRVQFVDIRGNDYTLNMNHDDDIGFTFIAPKAQWHNTSYGALLCQRIPQKQYRRGICENNTQLLGSSGSNAGISFQTLDAVFVNPLNLKQAMEKHQAYAIAPQFLVDLDKKRVKCNNFVIGSVGKDNKNIFHVKLDDPDLFRQEVTDAFRRSNLELSLK